MSESRTVGDILVVGLAIAVVTIVAAGILKAIAWILEEIFGSVLEPLLWGIAYIVGAITIIYVTGYVAFTVYDNAKPWLEES